MPFVFSSRTGICITDPFTTAVQALRPVYICSPVEALVMVTVINIQNAERKKKFNSLATAAGKFNSVAKFEPFLWRPTSVKMSP